MSIFGLLFYIIIFAIIINAKKEAKGGNGQRKNDNEGKYSASKRSSALKERMISSNVHKKEKSVIPNVQERGQQAIPNVPRKQEKKRTFWEPHKEETLQPKIRTNNLWGEDRHAGKRIVALRLMEGDPVPQGYVAIKCPYCAAPNLVTKNCKQYHSCYFCRVPID